MKKKILAAVLSAIFMGSGQIYNKQWTKGTIFIILNTVIILLMKFLFNSIQGFISLGDIPRQDHSLYLMVRGIIALFILFSFLMIYIYNIKDAYRTRKAIEQNCFILSNKINIRKIKDSSFPFIILIPSLFLILVVAAVPLIFMISLAFTNYDLYHVPPARLVDWVSLENFKNIFTLDSWKRTIISTFSWSIIWTIGSVATTFFLGLFIAVILNNPKIKYRSIFRTIMIFPWVIPPFVMLLGFRGFFNSSFGPANILLKSIGLLEIHWFQSVFWARVMVLIVNLYLGFPFFMILCSGIIQSIDTNLYEAATVDGAGNWKAFWNITFPLVMYSAAPLLIMSLATSFYNFNGIYLLTGGGPPIQGLRGAGGTDILISWVFKISFDTLYKYNYAAVISLIIFIIIASISIWNLRKTRQFKEEGVI